MVNLNSALLNQYADICTLPVYLEGISFSVFGLDPVLYVVGNSTIIACIDDGRDDTWSMTSFEDSPTNVTNPSSNFPEDFISLLPLILADQLFRQTQR